MIITKTPFRVSLFGGGSDHPRWFLANGGQVLSFAIDKYCYLTTRVLPPFFTHKYRIAYSKVETTKDFNSINHPVVRECIRKYASELDLEIHHDGDLPAKSGIGSSSAFAVGMIHSLLALKRIQVTKYELADFAIEMEQVILKENVGWQDQIACAFGGVNSIEFGPGNNWKLNPINLKRQFQEQLSSRMILVFSGVTRNSSDVSSGLLKNMNTKEKQIQQMVDLARNCKLILETEGDLDSIGEMLDYSWELKKEINPNATNSVIEGIYRRAKQAGALGGKVLGAGGGGFILLWLPKASKDDFSSKMKDLTTVSFNLCLEGSKVIYDSAL